MVNVDVEPTLTVTDDQASTEDRRPDPGPSPGDSRGTLYCRLCARDASYATVVRGEHVYCSVDCAEALPGRYFG